MSSTLSGSNTGDWRGFDSIFAVDSQELEDAFPHLQRCQTRWKQRAPLPGLL
jgi:hypothetical protein